MTKTIYLVCEVTDFEYANTTPIKAYETHEQAEQAIEDLGQEKIKFWTGSEINKYNISELEMETEVN